MLLCLKPCTVSCVQKDEQDKIPIRLTEIKPSVIQTWHRSPDILLIQKFSFNEEGFYIQSVQFSHSVISDSLQPHGLQHTRLPWPSPTLRACSNSCPSNWWCHLTISSSVVPFSSLLQSFPTSGSFPMNQFFTSGGQRFGASASASVLPMNIQDWFPLGWTGWISLQFKGLSRVFSKTTVQKTPFLWCSAFFMVQLSHPYMTTGKTIALTRRIFVSKVMSLLFNMLPSFLPRSKWLNFMAAVTICSDFGAQDCINLLHLWLQRI